MSEYVKYGSDEDCGFFVSDFICNLLVQIFCGYIYTYLILVGLGVNMFGQFGV